MYTDPTTDPTNYPTNEPTVEPTHVPTTNPTKGNLLIHIFLYRFVRQKSEINHMKIYVHRSNK